MAKISANRLGLTVGIFTAAIHAVWAIIVALGIAQIGLDWVFPLHFLDNVFSTIEFGFVSALLLVVLGFVGGYVCGAVLGWLWNKIQK